MDGTGISGGSGDDGGSSGIDSSLCGKVLSTGSNHSRLISRSHSSVGVSDQGGDMDGTGISGGNGGKGSSSVGRSGSDDGGSSGIDSSLGGKVLSTGSNNSRLISRSHSSVSVGDQ